MTDHLVNIEAAKHATALQREAARPDHSVFVSANAGTGKTQVLTMRVLRLLLSGAPADTILCLTYTKAAAAEMRHRLNKELSSWAICDESALLDRLGNLGIARPSQTQIDTARSLFAHILDHEDGPLIETFAAADFFAVMVLFFLIGVLLSLWPSDEPQLPRGNFLSLP